jgi:hypothetical protein
MTEETNSSSVVILSSNLSADKMIEMVGLDPDRKWNLNDPITKAGRGRRPTSGLRYDSPLDPERPITDHVHAVAQRLEPSRERLVGLKQRFQSKQYRGSIQLTIFTYRPTDSIVFLIDVEDMAFLAGVCTSLRVSVSGDPEAIDGE